MVVMNLAEGINLLERRARIVRVLLIAGLAVSAAVLIGELGEIGGSIDLENPNPSPMEQFYLLALLLDALLTLVTIVVFSMWIYRAAANVVAADVAGFNFTPGWAVGWYFVPFANLVQPFVAMRQIWNASHADGKEIDCGNPVLTLWWTTWLVSNVSANISMQMALRATTPETYQLSLQIGVASTIINLALLVVGLQLVERITAAQRERLSPAHIFA